MRLAQLAFALACPVATGCSISSARPGTGVVLVGDWGGPHAALTLEPTGGTIAYDCAHGGLSVPVIPDGDGNFDVRGVHVRERGGPVRMGEIPDSAPARYVGRVDGSRMSLRVAVGADTLGPFQLQRSTPAQLVRCL